MPGNEDRAAIPGAGRPAATGKAALASVLLLIGVVVSICWLAIGAVVDQWPKIVELVEAGRAELERWSNEQGLSDA